MRNLNSGGKIMEESRERALSLQFIGAASGLLDYLFDEEVTDLLINGTDSVYVERSGKLSLVPSPFRLGQQILDLIERLIVPLGKRVDATQPYIDGRLSDGSRFHIILPPVAPRGPLISIRLWRNKNRASIESFGTAKQVKWISEQIAQRKNLVIAGGTGSGKTTLLSRCIDEVNQEERIAIIEESLEIQCAHPHIVRLEGRSPNPEGRGEISLELLLKNVLRMRPDRIIVGECRGGETCTMLQAMNTGHQGSLSTVHANSARDALKRLEALTLLAGIPRAVAREWVGTGIGAVIYLEKNENSRKIKELALVRGIEGEAYRLSPIEWDL